MSMNLTLKDQILSEQGCLSPGADFLEIVILMPSWQLVHDNRNEQLYRMAVDLLLAYADQSKESPQPSVWEMAPRVLQTIADTVRLLAIDDFGDGLTCTPLELDTGLFKISLHTMTAKEVGEQARTDTEQVSSPSQRGVDIDLTSEMVEWMSWSPNACEYTTAAF